MAAAPLSWALLCTAGDPPYPLGYRPSQWRAFPSLYLWGSIIVMVGDPFSISLGYHHRNGGRFSASLSLGHCRWMTGDPSPPFLGHCFSILYLYPGQCSQTRVLLSISASLERVVISLSFTGTLRVSMPGVPIALWLGHCLFMP